MTGRHTDMQLTTGPSANTAAQTEITATPAMPVAVHRALRVPLVLATIVLLGTALRAFRLGHQSLWYDELLTLLSSTGSVWHVLTQTDINTNIPQLYYLLVNAALALGAGEAMLRLPSVLAGSLSIPLVFLALRHWVGARIALGTAALIAFSPFLVWYSQEARPYALFLALALLALWCFSELLKKPDSRVPKAGLVIAAAASFHAHTIAIGLFAVLGMLVLAFVQRRDWLRWMALSPLILLLMLPAVHRLMTFPPDAPSRADYQFSLVHLGYAFWTFATGYSVGPTVAELQGPNPLQATVQYVWIIVPVGALFSALVFLGIRHLSIGNRAGLVYLLVWLLTPLLVVLLGTVVSDHAFNVRYAILAAPAFFALVAAGIQSIPAGYLQRAAWCLVLLVSALSLGSYYFDPKYHREDTRSAAEFLRAHARPNDVVIVSAPYMTLALEHYAGRPDLRVLHYPGSGGRSLFGAYDAPGRSGAQVTEERRVAAALRQLGHAEGRYWLFLSRAARSDPAGHLQTASETLFTRSASFEASGVRLRLYLANERQLREQ